LQEALPHFKAAHHLNPNEENTKNYVNLLIEINDLPKGLSVLNEFLKIYPDSPEILRLMALILTDMEIFLEAETAIKKATSLSEKNAALWEQYGLLRLREHKYDDAILLFEKSLSLGLTSAGLFQDLAFVHAKSGNVKTALHYFEQALQLDNKDPAVRHSYGMALLSDEQFSQGWKEFEWRIVAKDHVRFKHPSETKKWDGTASLKGKTILVYYEQGLGDTIQFSRYIYELAKLEVDIYFCIQDKLKNLFNGINFPATFCA
jgi:tetratricopeptide (TPR) repeat protein